MDFYSESFEPFGNFGVYRATNGQLTIYEPKPEVI